LRVSSPIATLLKSEGSYKAREIDSYKREIIKKGRRSAKVETKK